MSEGTALVVDADARATRATTVRLAAVADLLLILSFFISGGSALVYQVGWQRALFAQLGVDTDSVTIVVSVFMLGIGVGGMVGGWLADLLPRARLQLYGAVELTIGGFGFVSLQFLPWLVHTLSAAQVGGAAQVAACILFLAVPTLLMGVTLPLLTMAFDERRRNIGVAVGTLYLANTLGAATGAALVPLYLLPAWSLPEVIRFAAYGNLSVIACVVLAVVLTRSPE